MDIVLATWIYGLSLSINAVVAAIVFYLVAKERKEGPVLKGSLEYWFITKIADIGSKEIWTRDKLNSNVWMYEDDGTEVKNGDHVCTLRHEKPSIIIFMLVTTICPIVNTVLAVRALCKMGASTIEDGIDSNRLVNYPHNYYHDHVPSKKDDYDDIDRCW